MLLLIGLFVRLVSGWITPASGKFPRMLFKASSNNIQTNPAPTSNVGEMSLIKQGIKFPSKLDGSEVRVGIIMARWNDDVIQGLYNVCCDHEAEFVHFITLYCRG